MDIDNIGKRILKIRQSTNLTQKKFAEVVNVAYSSVSAMEKGKKTPSFRSLISIVDATKASADWLLTGDGAMYLQIKKEKQDIKEINEDKAAYGADKSPGFDDVLDILKSHWDKLSDVQKKVLTRQVKEMVKNNEILLEENRRLKDFLIKIATNQPGEIPSNVVQGLTD
jgi:transcriptional regulator with XRE-family HTH domain